jgi:hypothetical protein
VPTLKNPLDMWNYQEIIAGAASVVLEPARVIADRRCFRRPARGARAA